MAGADVSPFIIVRSSLAPYREQKKEGLVLEALIFQLSLPLPSEYIRKKNLIKRSD